jgi:predicted helicase
MQYQTPAIFPTAKTKNILIAVDQSNKPFNLLASDYLVDLHFNGDSQCFPLYRYDKKGKQIENITNWGLEQFRSYYRNKKISKENIFHYVYSVLHNPVYRKKYEQNLKREFPRIPFYDDFNWWVQRGEALMDLHLNYETITPFRLRRTEKKEIKENPKCLLKADKDSGVIYIDENILLEKIPAEAWQYKLGNRSAMEWVLDQYKEKKIKDPTVRAKFNTYKFADYKEEVIELLKKVCKVSIETMKIIKEMEKK